MHDAIVPGKQLADDVQRRLADQRLGPVAVPRQLFRHLLRLRCAPGSSGRLLAVPVRVSPITSAFWSLAPRGPTRGMIHLELPEHPRLDGQRVDPVTRSSRQNLPGKRRCGLVQHQHQIGVFVGLVLQSVRQQQFEQRH